MSKHLKESRKSEKNTLLFLSYQTKQQTIVERTNLAKIYVNFFLFQRCKDAYRSRGFHVIDDHKMSHTQDISSNRGLEQTLKEKMATSLYIQTTQDTYREGNDVNHMQSLHNIKLTQGRKLENQSKWSIMSLSLVSLRVF